MALPQLDFTIDGTQWRQSRDRIGFSAGGDNFDTGQYYSGTWIDPVTSTLFLRPAPLDLAFFTSNSGAYAKLGLSDFGLSTGWHEADSTDTGGSKYLCKEGSPSSPTTIITTATWAKNTGFCVSVFAHTEGSRATLFECGWDSASSITSHTAIRVYTDGFCEIWRAGVKIAEGDISGAKGGAAVNNQIVQVMLIPCRRRELLVVSCLGNGIRGVFEDISEGDTDPTITEATNFWVKKYGTVVVQVAPLKYATSGYACSTPVMLAEAPPTSAPLEPVANPAWASGSGRIYGDKSYRTGATDAAVVSLVKLDGSTAFTPNGTDKDLRIKVALTGDGNSSPAIYGISGGYKAASANTDSSESASLNAVWQHCSFQVPETGGPEWNIDTINPTSSGVIGLYDHDSKPLQIKLGTTVIHDGVTESADIQDSTDASTEKVGIKSNPHITQALKDYSFRERIVFDGMPISHASNDCIIRRLIKLVGGSDSDMSLETASVTAGEIAPAMCGQFSEMADIGENGWDYLCRVMQDYLGGWWYGEYPSSSGMIFTTKSPTTINAASSLLTLYSSTAAAISAGVTSANAWKRVWRQKRHHRIRPEANEIVVTGFDPRNQWPVQSVKRDANSIDPTIKPSLRASNWIGGPKRLGVINKGINSQAVADGGAALLYDRCSVSRSIQEIELELPTLDDTTGMPLWVSDKVTLDGIGDFIVSSIQGAVEKDPNGADTWMWRPCTYVLSNIVGHSDVAGFEAVAALAVINAMRSTIARRGFIDGSMTRFKVGFRTVL